MELAVGTIRLEGTSEAVDKEMAAQLIPYWQLLDEITASEATSPAEITAVVENISEVTSGGGQAGGHPNGGVPLDGGWSL